MHAHRAPHVAAAWTTKKNCLHTPRSAQRTSPGAGSLLTAAEAAPPSAQWTTQADFLAQCSELAPSGIPADHPSMLAPLFHHPANHPLPYDALFNEIEAAMGATQAIKSGAAQAPRLSCLRDVLPAGTAQRSRPRIGGLSGDTWMQYHAQVPHTMPSV